MNDRDRRTFLKWLSGMLSGAVASIVGIPAISYTIGTLRRQGSRQAEMRRAARLQDLPSDRPVMIPIIGNLQDAWTLHPNEAIGRVWLKRGAIDSTDPARTVVTALTAVCPHLGCTVQLAGDGKHFVCPCHNAAFAFDGQRAGSEKPGRPGPAPRNMDALQYQIVQDEASKDWWVEVKYEVFEQGRTSRIVVA